MNIVVLLLIILLFCGGGFYGHTAGFSPVYWGGGSLCGIIVLLISLRLLGLI